jgi:N6-L-threonylcarbamoyladenine synthase
MNIIGPFIHARAKNICVHTSTTYGYITSCIRKENFLPKTHAVDARCCSGNAKATPTTVYLVKQTRRQNRQLHKSTTTKGGKRQATRTAKYVFGFGLFDRVMYKGKTCFITARRITGSFALKLLSGEVISAGVSYKKLRLLSRATTFAVQLS